MWPSQVDRLKREIKRLRTENKRLREVLQSVVDADELAIMELAQMGIYPTPEMREVTTRVRAALQPEVK